MPRCEGTTLTRVGAALVEIRAWQKPGHALGLGSGWPKVPRHRPVGQPFARKFEDKSDDWWIFFLLCLSPQRPARITIRQAPLRRVNGVFPRVQWAFWLAPDFLRRVGGRHCQERIRRA
jgi:hypothetical protein